MIDHPQIDPGVDGVIVAILSELTQCIVGDLVLAMEIGEQCDLTVPSRLDMIVMLAFSTAVAILLAVRLVTAAFSYPEDKLRDGSRTAT